MLFTENEDFGCAENVVRVVNFRLGRLKNTAPVHKSKFRKRFEFILARGAFWSAFGSPFGSLWDPLGHIGVTLGYLGTPLGPFLVTLGPLGHHFGGHGLLFNILNSKVQPGHGKT